MVLAAQIALAFLSGWLGYVAYAPSGFWPAGIVSVGLLFAALKVGQPGYRMGGLIGFIQGATLYALMLPWIGELVGTFPYVALVVSLALYSLPLGIAGVAVARWRYGFLAFPALFVAIEHARSSFPFGGFAWVRLAWGQVDGPLATLATYGGPALVSFSAALAGTSLVALALRPRIPAIAVLLLTLTTGVVSGVHRADPTGSATVAAIQGNVPRLGLDFNAQRRAVLNNHVRVTEKLAASGARPDLVIWPENSSDVNPFADEWAFDSITRAVRAIDAPVLIGTLTADEVGDRNTMQVFDPHTGPGDFHHKKFLQPFGEYMPFRDFFRMLSSYVDLAGDFKPGNGTSTVRMGDIVVGIATCYEVIVDDAYRSAIRNGAQILATPTNNATFGFSDMTYQQLAMSRMRAIELDRAVVVAATSGSSAIILPDGRITQSSGIFEAASLVEELPLKDSVTPAVHFGAAIQWLLSTVGVCAALAALVTKRNRRK